VSAEVGVDSPSQGGMYGFLVNVERQAIVASGEIKLEGGISRRRRSGDRRCRRKDEK